MTFWQDAPSAAPRFRMPQRPRPSRDRSRRKRRAMVVTAAVVIATVVVSVVHAGGETPAKAATPAAARRADRRRANPTAVPPVWSRTLRSWAGTLLSDGGAAGIVVGDRWVTSVVLTTGTRRWETPLAGVQPLGALGRDTVLLATEHSFVALDRTTGEGPVGAGHSRVSGARRARRAAGDAADRGGLDGGGRTGRSGRRHRSRALVGAVHRRQ